MWRGVNGGEVWMMERYVEVWMVERCGWWRGVWRGVNGGEVDDGEVCGWWRGVDVGE